MTKWVTMGMVVSIGVLMVLSGQSRADDNCDLAGPLLEIKAECQAAADAAAEATAACSTSTAEESSCANACELACDASYEQYCGSTNFACGDAALSCAEAAVECGSVSVSQTCEPNSPELEDFCAPYIDLLSQPPTLGSVLDDLKGTVCRKMRHKEKQGRVRIKCRLR